MRRFIDVSIVVMAAAASSAPAWAGFAPPSAPGPVIGLGIPALAAFGLAYRHLRNRKGK